METVVSRNCFEQDKWLSVMDCFKSLEVDFLPDWTQWKLMAAWKVGSQSETYGMLWKMFCTHANYLRFIANGLKHDKPQEWPIHYHGSNYFIKHTHWVSRICHCVHQFRFIYVPWRNEHSALQHHTCGPGFLTIWGQQRPQTLKKDLKTFLFRKVFSS